MSRQSPQQRFEFPSEVDDEVERGLLTSLLQNSKLYSRSESYLELLDFVSRLPQFAPFNAMLLNVQKPGLRFAATERDWQTLFGRTIKEGTRPLVILWPFAPVVFVYDVVDTEGDPLPDSVIHAFRSAGSVSNATMQSFDLRLRKLGIHLRLIVFGDGLAGRVIADTLTAESRSSDQKNRSAYRIRINAIHDPNVQFGTLAHELAHLFLGHLGSDRYLKIADRSTLSRREREIEAESVAYLVCRRAGIELESESYLVDYLSDESKIDQVDVNAVMRAAGQVEGALGIALRSKVD